MKRKLRFDNRVQGRIAVAIVTAVLAVIALNVTLSLKLSRAQGDELGNTQLDVIRSDLEDTLTEAETSLLRVAMGAEQLMKSGASQQDLTAYFYAQRDKHQSNASFKNVYVANPDLLIVPDFNAPEGFHATERSWYIGAQEHPGEVFISEPYLDAEDGEMCFTVSTLLSDAKTIVGMDLNFSGVQSTILRMTQGRERTAMIVTSGGLIAGYTDMSLVGERADEKLPEYADILRRVASSQKHDSFRVELDGRPCMIFSSETDNGWYLILSVDTGIGMDKEFLPRLFEAFSQEDAGATNRYGGSGLGMAITRSIVEMMGGEIGVESEKGLGSTFTVSVTLGRISGPETPEAAADRGADGAAATAQSVSLEGRRVLIAEDQEMNAEILIDLLEMEGVASDWAEDGKRAVDMFERHEAGYFDAILTDMRMPVMDGLTAAQAIRRLNRPDAATIPIIALTANAFEEDVKACLQAGMNAHLSKPVDIDLLKARLAELLCGPAKRAGGMTRTCETRDNL